LCSPISPSPIVSTRFINWKKYNSILTNLPNSTTRPINNCHSIDLAIDCLTKNIQHAIEGYSKFLLQDKKTRTNLYLTISNSKLT
jgi:hypothetical protein